MTEKVNQTYWQARWYQSPEFIKVIIPGHWPRNYKYLVQIQCCQGLLSSCLEAKRFQSIGIPDPWVACSSKDNPPLKSETFYSPNKPFTHIGQSLYKSEKKNYRCKEQKKERSSNGFLSFCFKNKKQNFHKKSQQNILTSEMFFLLLGALLEQKSCRCYNKEIIRYSSSRKDTNIRQKKSRLLKETSVQTDNSSINSKKGKKIMKEHSFSENQVSSKKSESIKKGSEKGLSKIKRNDTDFQFGKECIIKGGLWVTLKDRQGIMHQVWLPAKSTRCSCCHCADNLNPKQRH